MSPKLSFDMRSSVFLIWATVKIGLSSSCALKLRIKRAIPKSYTMDCAFVILIDKLKKFFFKHKFDKNDNFGKNQFFHYFYIKLSLIDSKSNQWIKIRMKIIVKFRRNLIFSENYSHEFRRLTLRCALNHSLSLNYSSAHSDFH